jgi:hypothetical protein
MYKRVHKEKYEDIFKVEKCGAGAFKSSNFRKVRSVGNNSWSGLSCALFS